MGRREGERETEEGEREEVQKEGGSLSNSDAAKL